MTDQLQEAINEGQRRFREHIPMLEKMEDETNDFIDNKMSLLGARLREIRAKEPSWSDEELGKNIRAFFADEKQAEVECKAKEESSQQQLNKMSQDFMLELDEMVKFFSDEEQEEFRRSMHSEVHRQSIINQIQKSFSGMPGGPEKVVIQQVTPEAMKNLQKEAVGPAEELDVKPTPPATPKSAIEQIAISGVDDQ